MKYNHYLFVVMYLLSITALCKAMEINNALSIEEIIAVKNLRHVQYFGKNSVIVGTSDGGVDIVNVKTKKTHKINLPHSDMLMGFSIIQSNDKKIITCIDGKVKIYDAKMGEKVITSEQTAVRPIVRSIAWNSFKDTIFLCYGESRAVIKKCNYVTDACEEIAIHDKICQNMIIHPKQEIMCITDYSGNIFLYTLDNLTSPFKKIVLGGKSYFCKYSSDGSYIVAGNYLNVFIIDPNKNANVCLSAQINETFQNIAFHPNGSVLAILCKRYVARPRLPDRSNKQIVHYWNIKTQQFMYTTPELDSDGSYDIAFSDDGSESVIALEGKCVRMLVPFAIKEKCIHSLCVLNKFRLIEDVELKPLPQDVIRYVVSTFFETFKF